MAGDDWTFTAVYALPDGAFVEEALRCHGHLAEAAATARRDAALLAFGRQHLGFSACAPSGPHGTMPPRAVGKDTSRPLGELLDAQGGADDGAVAEEPPRLPVMLAGLEAVPWWSFEVSAGVPSHLGLALARCAAVDAPLAEAAAREVGQGIVAQRHLSEATAEALPFVVALLEHPDVRCREALLQHLEAVVQSAFEANDLTSNLLALTARVFARDLAGPMAQHQRSAREVALALANLKPRLEALAADASLGLRVSALIERL